MKENTDYELVPVEDDKWAVRFLTGPYTEMVVKYDAIKANEEQGCINFSFTIEHNNDIIVTEADEDLQHYVGEVLQYIIVDAIKADNGSIKLREIDAN
jgi:hypothetical protein